MKQRVLTFVSNPSALLWVSILAGFALRLLLALVPGYPLDLIGWGMLARYAVAQGVVHIYTLTSHQPELGLYPPLYHYLLALIGVIYQNFFSPSFANPSLTLNLLLKLVPVLGDAGLSLVIYAGVRSLAGKTTAIGATVAYILNPAIVFTSAYWGMFGDSLCVLGILLALVAMYWGRMTLAWMAIIVAISLKPQAVAFLPLVLWVTYRGATLRTWYRAGSASVLTLGVIWLPFILSGTISEAVDALRQTVGLFPVMSANAHNFWWLFSLANPWGNDATPLIGPLTPRIVGLVAFAVIYAYVLRSLKTPCFDKRLFSVAAYIAFAFFMLSTEMHENYLFPTVALLMFTFWQSRFLRVVAITLTITALANMALHDPLLRPTYWLSVVTAARLTILNSAINCAVFVLWTYRIVRGSRTMAAAPLPSPGQP